MTEPDPNRWQRLEELFSEAVALPEDRLEPWLEAHAARNPDTVRRLRVLLEHARRRIQNLESQRRDLEQTLSELYDIERQAQVALTGHATPAKAG